MNRIVQHMTHWTCLVVTALGVTIGFTSPADAQVRVHVTYGGIGYSYGHGHHIGHHRSLGLYGQSYLSYGYAWPSRTYYSYRPSYGVSVYHSHVHGLHPHGVHVHAGSVYSRPSSLLYYRPYYEYYRPSFYSAPSSFYFSYSRPLYVYPAPVTVYRPTVVLPGYQPATTVYLGTSHSSALLSHGTLHTTTYVPGSVHDFRMSLSRHYRPYYSYCEPCCPPTTLSMCPSCMVPTDPTSPPQQPQPEPLPDTQTLTPDGTSEPAEPPQPGAGVDTTQGTVQGPLLTAPTAN